MTIDTDNDQYSLALECPDKFSYSADIKVPDVLAVQPDFKARGKKVRRGLDRVVCNYLRYILWLSPGGWNAHIFKKNKIPRDFASLMVRGARLQRRFYVLYSPVICFCRWYVQVLR